VAEKRGITVDTDLRRCAFFGLEPGYWLRVQLAYDQREALHTIGPKFLKPERALHHGAHRGHGVRTLPTLRGFCGSTLPVAACLADVRAGRIVKSYDVTPSSGPGGFHEKA